MAERTGLVDPAYAVNGTSDSDREAQRWPSQDKEYLCECAREHFTLAQEAESEWRERALDDQRFAHGEQWHPALLQARKGRQCLVIDRSGTPLRQIVNEGRQNRLGIVISPAGYGATAETAKKIKGLIRNIEQLSSADIAYTTSRENAVRLGRGFVRILPVYTDDFSFQQELRIFPVRNAFSVYVDPFHQMPDASDINWFLVVERLSRDAYEQEYGDLPAESAAWAGTGDTWVSTDEVQVAEYWWREWHPLDLAQLADGSVQPVSRLTDAQKGQIRDRRTARVPQVWYAKINGYEVLHQSRWQGRFLPLAQHVGEAWDLEGKMDYQGLTRRLKDPQRQYNYWELLALDTPLPTPSGWTTVGEVQAGDVLFDEHGRPSEVLGMSPIRHESPCYRLHFDDGTSIVADESHLWTVEERTRRGGKIYGRTVTLSTKDLDPAKHVIPVAKPLDLPKRTLPIDPYVLGVWLGDGTSGANTITAGSEDVDDLRANLAACGYTLADKRKSKSAWVFALHGLLRKLRANNLLHNKHIPAWYFRASYEQRLALLQGLMDTDGSISKTFQCSFTTVRPALRDGFAELLRSLGIKAVCHVRERGTRYNSQGRPFAAATCWQFSFTPPEGQIVFRLPRKCARQLSKRVHHARRTQFYRIRRIEPVESVPVRCLTVDTPTHLFLAGVNMVPTHNSAKAEMIALAPKAPFVGAAQQFEGYQQFWASANVEPHAYLPYQPTVIAGQLLPPPQRMTAEAPVQAMVQGAAQAADEIKAISGYYDPALGQQTPDQSGVAIGKRQQATNTASYHYGDNERWMIRHIGRILVDALPFYYSGERTERIVGDDDRAQQVTLNTPYRDPETGQEVLYDVTVGKYDVTIDAGPSWANKRQESAEKLGELMTAAPQLMQVFGDDYLQSLNFDLAEHAAERIRKTMPPALLQGEPGAEKYMAAQQQLQQLQQLPQLQQTVQQQQKNLMQMQEAINSLTQSNQQLTLALENKQKDQALEQQKLDQEAAEKQRQWQLDQRKLDIDAYDKETNRLKVTMDTTERNVQGGPYE